VFRVALSFNMASFWHQTTCILLGWQTMLFRSNILVPFSGHNITTANKGSESDLNTGVCRLDATSQTAGAFENLRCEGFDVYSAVNDRSAVI
jgi:hypothetical protein